VVGRGHASSAAGMALVALSLLFSRRRRRRR
jgi:MYXO-CTERM domain-containing protein